MNKSISSIISYVNEVLPNAVQSTTLNTFIDEIVRTVKHYTPNIAVWSTQTVADQQAYTLPDHINVRDIISMHISNTTYNATTLVTSTLDWNPYRFVGYEDREKGLAYFRATTVGSSAERICLSPIPDDVVYMKTMYWGSPQTSESTDIIKNDYMVDYIQNKLLAMIAKTGTYPRIDLANNYELEAMQNLTRLKLERKKVERELKERFKGYKDWWC